MPPSDEHAIDPTSRLAADLRGVGRLAIDGVTGATDIVEAMHAAIGHLPAILGRPAPATTTGLTGFVYRSVRGVTRLVGAGVDRSLAALAPVLGGGGVSPQREALVAAINGVLGDHLETSGNPLAIRMQFRVAGAPLERDALPANTRGKLLVTLHGLCMNDLQWRYAGHDHGEALAREHDYTRVDLHYNTGRPVAANGLAFATLLDQLVHAWPVPVEEIVLLCHSMGGLVARRALEAGLREQLAWTQRPVRIVFLGTPHHGAPLERAGAWADQLIAISPYSAPFVKLGKVRSAGITDLRHGTPGDAPKVPKHVRLYAIAARTDGLVPVASAFGEHDDPARNLRIPASRRWLSTDTHHLGLLGSEAVYQRLARWLRR
ncbi:permease [Lysobacter helvus]|uniref:Permease n=2 Tax=Lysobacteraceae TaxID=32033 RepID=A0ABM7Q8J0_9GAMM|nr:MULTISPECIES: hypothetical protein [Lysobacter]BCT93744.1 permease [Lysobacter caseinilyticus]BCT96900.1 permease [Lysobacter helvus]